MAYMYSYINKLHQFGRISYSLILTDPEGVLPTKRIEKCFKCPVSDEMLATQANQDIQNVLDELAAAALLSGGGE